MNSETVRYTATLPLPLVNELEKMAKERLIPSVNYAINEALDEYLKDRKTTRYEELMREAGHDKAFLARTIRCQEGFEIVDGEVLGEW